VKSMTPSMTAIEKHPGAEPLPGYRLLRLLGRGGFGEVWKCEAPGRLHKAIKFVPGGNQLRTELAAFEHMRTIRHPYLMTLERVDLVAGELVMVMELADGQVNDRFRACVKDGLRGIPRDELLGYLEEAAEALDYLSNRYRLQHLDVKPENLLLLAGHVKMGDYGLVRPADQAQATSAPHLGFTPRYAAPEVLSGEVDHRSDQYSLALVFVELLTGVFPFSGTTAQQVMVQHITAVPDLAALPAHDREVALRALSKQPAARFASSSEFIRALIGIDSGPHAVLNISQSDVSVLASSDAAATGHATTMANHPRRLSGVAYTPGLARTAVEHLPSGGSLPGLPRTHRPRSSRQVPPPPPKPAVLQQVVLTDQLHGLPRHKVPASQFSKDTLVQMVVNIAAQSCRAAEIDTPPNAIVRHFLSTIPAALIPLKLAAVANSRNLRIDQGDPSRVILRHESPPKWRLLSRQPMSGYDITIHFPADSSAAVTVMGSLFGAPNAELVRRAEGEIAAIIEEIKHQLQNKVERRAHPRFPADFLVLAYPYYTDGDVGAPVAGQCRDISEGGIRFASLELIRCSQIYVEFKDLDPVAGSAVLVQIIRTGQEPNGREFFTVGRFGTSA
jgi:eukaryotic-like serine/threonine-protein kinase